MGEALLGGLITNGWAPADDLMVVEPDEARCRELEAAHPGIVTASAPVADVDALLAVKPNIVPAALEALRAAGCARVLSIAAGVTIAALEAGAGTGVAVVRAMPNTPSLVGLGAAAVAGGAHAGDADVDWAMEILGAVGVVVRVDEAQLDAVTGLSGSGPAYVFLLAESMMAAGVAQGLSNEVARELVEQTLLGAASLLRSSDDGPATLRENVTSPGGTTAAGLAVFAAGGFTDLVAAVVAAATERSVELGQQ